MIKILGIPSTLRKNSFNTGLLKAAINLAPSEAELELLDISAIPLYNGDLEEAGDPAAVTTLKEKVAQADCLLIATAEYNASIPGVLKNIIDWASRPTPARLKGKPVALIGATPGGFGTTRSQPEVRRTLTHTGAYVMPKPDLFVSKASEHFDDQGNLVDEKTKELLQTVIEELICWTKQLNK